MSLSLQFEFPPDLVTRYATNMAVQGGEHEVTISFFEAHPPLITEPLQTVDSLVAPAECVARIVIAKGRLPEFVHLLQVALEREREAGAVVLEETAQ